MKNYNTIPDEISLAKYEGVLYDVEYGREEGDYIITLKANYKFDRKEGKYYIYSLTGVLYKQTKKGEDEDNG